MHEMSPDFPNVLADQYRVADLELFPAGDNLILVYSKANQTAKFLRAEAVDLLMQCREFKTLDCHIQDYCSRRQVSIGIMHTLRRELQRLAQNGYLISQSSFLESPGSSYGQASPNRVVSVGFPTSNRVESLRQSLTSYIENCQHFERTVDFIVVDDSENIMIRNNYREMLQKLKSQYSVNIFYAGLEEKIAFAKKLAKKGKIPENAVYFACIGDKQHAMTTVGANRNVLLLHTVGDMILSADDDTLCRSAISPTMKEGLALSSGGSPLEVHFFPDRESAMQSVHFVEQDFIALHEQWLGKDVRGCIAVWGRDGKVSLDHADPQLLRRLATQQGKVALTLNGVIGDCSWDNPYYYLFQDDNTFVRLTQSEQDYRLARTSREMIQVACQNTLTEKADTIFAICMGLDNRDLLPPFTPIGRAEDIAFGIALSKCFSGNYAVHLPWALPHIPREVRSYSAQQLFSIGFNSWIPSCIDLFDPGFAITPSERLQKLGYYLKEIGSLPKAAFEEFIRLHLWRSMSALISELEKRIQNDEAPPAFWLRDARAFITQARQSALLPVEQLYMLSGGQEVLQRLMIRFGQVLEWWPVMMETARQLRSEGDRLAQPLGG
jgi:hypothetical protein